MWRLQVRSRHHYIRYCEREWLQCYPRCPGANIRQSYSNGLSEIILGKAIKEFKLPREELVIMAKVSQSRRDRILATGRSCIAGRETCGPGGSVQLFASKEEA